MTTLSSSNSRVTHPTGTCPKCNGTKRTPVPEESQKWKTMISGYDPATDTFACTNCGAQHMFGQSTGVVFLNEDGQPCLHEYKGTQLGNCYWRYDCKHCPESHCIDSGD